MARSISLQILLCFRQIMKKPTNGSRVLIDTFELSRQVFDWTKLGFFVRDGADTRDIIELKEKSIAKAKQEFDQLGPEASGQDIKGAEDTIRQLTKELYTLKRAVKEEHQDHQSRLRSSSGTEMGEDEEIGKMLSTKPVPNSVSEINNSSRR